MEVKEVRVGVCCFGIPNRGASIVRVVSSAGSLLVRGGTMGGVRASADCSGNSKVSAKSVYLKTGATVGSSMGLGGW